MRGDFHGIGVFMARKIVGLDIGSHSIKVVVARERLGRIDLQQFYERPVSNGSLQEIIRGIFQEGKIHPDIVVSSVPGNRVSVHYLKIPFSDEAKIVKVIPYEVEGVIPFPLEDMVIDQFILSKGNGAGPEHGSSVCVALIKKETLKDHIDSLKGAYIDPKVIELESLALYHTYTEWYKTEDTVALLDIGASRSNLCIVSKGKPGYVRTFNRGGNGITSTIQDNLGIGFEEAEEKKISTGIILYETTGEEENDKETVSSVIKKGLDPFITELKQSLHAYEIQYNEPVTKLYIAGGSSRLINIDKFLGNELDLEVEHLSVPNEMLQKLPGVEGAGTLIPTGVGLVLRGAQKKHASGLNFRKGEYFYGKEVKESTGRILYIIAAIIVVILLGSIDFYSRYQDRMTRHQQIKSDIRKAYIETFPGTTNIVSENQQLKSAVEELKKKVTALGGGKNREMGALDLLNTINEKIPKELQVNINDFFMDKSKIRLQGNSDSFENVERLKKELEGITLFKKVDVSEAKLSADQKLVKFRIIIDL